MALISSRIGLQDLRLEPFRCPYLCKTLIPQMLTNLRTCLLDQTYRSILLFIHTVFVKEGFVMARESDIHATFVGAVTKDSKGRQIVTTAAFQKRLDDVNHVWTLQECNRWIRYY